MRKKTGNFIEPMKALSVETLPVGKEWIYEIKLDGYRALIIRDKNETNMFSLNGNSFNERFESVWKAAQSITSESFIIDGEIVALDEKGHADFQTLQNLKSRTSNLLRFYAFDILLLNKKSLVDQPLSKRRKILKKIVKGSKVLFSEGFTGDPTKLLKHVNELGLEGLIAKRIDSIYSPGTRSSDWLKYKVINEQELVIGGYTKKSAELFHNLLMGYYDEEGTFLYAGKIYGGFTPAIRKKLFPLLKRLVTKNCPFADLPEQSAGRWGSGLTAQKMKECTWLKPKLVCVTRFAEWTENNHLRHGAFVAMRDDKNPKDVGRS